MSSATLKQPSRKSDNRKSDTRTADEDVATSAHELSAEVAGELVQMFKLLADDTRLRILFHLKHQDELNVQSICSLLHQTQPAVSHHLALLRVGGLIAMRRNGKHNFYRLEPLRFARLLAAITQFAPEEARRLQAKYDFSKQLELQD